MSGTEFEETLFIGLTCRRRIKPTDSQTLCKL